MTFNRAFSIHLSKRDPFFSFNILYIFVHSYYYIYIYVIITYYMIQDMIYHIILLLLNMYDTDNSMIQDILISVIIIIIIIIIIYVYIII